MTKKRFNSEKILKSTGFLQILMNKKGKQEDNSQHDGYHDPFYFGFDYIHNIFLSRTNLKEKCFPLIWVDRFFEQNGCIVANRRR